MRFDAHLFSCALLRDQTMTQSCKIVILRRPHVLANQGPIREEQIVRAKEQQHVGRILRNGEADPSQPSRNRAYPSIFAHFA